MVVPLKFIVLHFIFQNGKHTSGPLLSFNGFEPTTLVNLEGYNHKDQLFSHLITLSVPFPGFFVRLSVIFCSITTVVNQRVITRKLCTLKFYGVFYPMRGNRSTCYFMAHSLILDRITRFTRWPKPTHECNISLSSCV